MNPEWSEPRVINKSWVLVASCVDHSMNKRRAGAINHGLDGSLGGQYTSSAVPCCWQCRRCAGLRYASEGGALLIRGRGALARILTAAFGPGHSPRPEPWYPYVFKSPQEAAEAGFCALNG